MNRLKTIKTEEILTGGKTRQKRNGPGGLCAAEGFARRRPAGADLVHDSPQNPCSFVDGHHVFGTKGAAGEPDVVLQSPQTLALSSTGTTSLGPKAPPASVPISISLQKERIDDGTSGQSVPSSISTDFNRNSWN